MHRPAAGSVDKLQVVVLQGVVRASIEVGRRRTQAIEDIHEQMNSHGVNYSCGAGWNGIVAAIASKNHG